MHNAQSRFEAVEELQGILDANAYRRVCIIGTFCCGKSTIAGHLTGVRDMDEVVFPQLSAQEAASVNRAWSPEVGETMTRLARRYASILPGQALIGTVLLDCDFAVHLRISDELLGERTTLRAANFDDAKALDRFIEAELAASHLLVVEVSLG